MTTYRRDFVRTTWVLPVLVAGLWGCPQKSGDHDDEPKTSTPSSKPAAAASKPAAAESPSNPCFAPFDASGEATTVKAGGVSFEHKGSVLTMAKDDDSTTRLGVLGNIKEFSSENEAAIAKYVAFFKEKKVDAVVVTGDVGETEADIGKALSAVAKAGVPVFTIVGNRENGDDFEKAVASVAGQGVINLNQIRLVHLDDHAIVSLPGYHDANYIHAERGCLYGADEVAEVEKALAATGDVPAIVVSHGPPLQSGAHAIDKMSEGDHVGNPALTALFKKSGVNFSISSNIQEAGGRGSNADGSKLVKAGEMAEQLHFNPGGADRTVPWNMGGDKFAYGMAAVVTYDGAKASYEVLKLPAPENN